MSFFIYGTANPNSLSAAQLGTERQQLKKGCHLRLRFGDLLNINDGPTLRKFLTTLTLTTTRR